MNDFRIIHNNKLLDILRFTIDFLDSHNLKYWAAYGTMLGAVRHKGLIPWDDDIDLFMPRDDYERLLDLNTELQGGKYQLVSLRTDNYYLPFAKVEDMTTTIWEHENLPFVFGLYVDIFPLDLFAGSEEAIMNNYRLFRKKRNAYARSISRLNIDEFKSLWVEKRFKMMLYRLCDVVYRFNHKKFYKDFCEFEKTQNNPLGNNYVIFSSPTEDNIILPKEWFDEIEKVPFEDIEINIPKGYDSYLKYTYGDYMTPPPIEERTFAHQEMRYYINLKERLSIEEIKQRKTKGEKIVY